MRLWLFVLVFAAFSLLAINALQRQTISNLKAENEYIKGRKPNVALAKEKKSGDIYIKVDRHFFHFKRVCTPIKET
jgi:hypothetical protein